MWRVTELKHLTWELRESFTFTTWNIQHVSTRADAACLSSPVTLFVSAPQELTRHGYFSAVWCLNWSIPWSAKVALAGWCAHKDGEREREKGAPPPITKLPSRATATRTRVWKEEPEPATVPRGRRAHAARGAGKLPQTSHPRRQRGHRRGASVKCAQYRVRPSSLPLLTQPRTAPAPRRGPSRVATTALGQQRDEHPPGFVGLGHRDGGRGRGKKATPPQPAPPPCCWKEPTGTRSSSPLS